MYTLARWSSVVVLLAIVITAAPLAARAASTTVTIHIPPTQALEGTTQLVVPPSGTIHSGTLTVKSNISWAVVARVSGGQGELAGRAAGSSVWQPLGDMTVLARGEKGAHTIQYEVRGNPSTAGRVVVVAFSIVATD